MIVFKVSLVIRYLLLNIEKEVKNKDGILAPSCEARYKYQSAVLTDSEEVVGRISVGNTTVMPKGVKGMVSENPEDNSLSDNAVILIFLNNTVLNDTSAAVNFVTYKSD